MVSTAQKLPASEGLTAGEGCPGPLLAKNLAFVDQEVGAFLTELRKQHLDGNTTVILSSKHGQSPTDPKALTRIDDGPLLDGLNAAWKKAHPGAGDLVAHSVDDDAMLLWLNDRSQAATAFAKAYLLARSGTGNDIAGKAKPFHRERPEDPVRRRGGRQVLPRQGGRLEGAGTCSASPTTASSTPAARARSPSTAAPTPTTSTSRSSSRAPPPARRARQRPGGDHADRPDDPATARPQPPVPGGRSRRAHRDPAGALTPPRRSTDGTIARDGATRIQPWDCQGWLRDCWT